MSGWAILAKAILGALGGAGTAEGKKWEEKGTPKVVSTMPAAGKEAEEPEIKKGFAGKMRR